jgi:hypothetical protein
MSSCSKYFEELSSCQTTIVHIQNAKLFHKAEHRKIFLNIGVQVIYNVPNEQMKLES